MTSRNIGEEKVAVVGNSDATVTEHPLSRQIGFLIRKLYQKNQMIWNEMCVDSQITSPQASVLSVLVREGLCSLTTLGRAAAMDPATTRGVVDRLKKRNMVSLGEEEGDRRKVILRIEEAGWEFHKKMQPIIPQIADRTLSPLNVAERVALYYLLVKLTQEDTKNGEASDGPEYERPAASRA